MTTISGETVIGRPVEQVFDFVADERNEPTFNPSMTRVRQLTEGPIDVGTRFAATSHSMGRDVDMVIEFTAYDRPRLLASTTTMPSAEVHGTLAFDAHPAGTRMRWSWDIRPHGAIKFLAPLIAHLGRRQEEAIWTGLKRHLEGEPAKPG